MEFVRVELSAQYSLLLIDIIRVHIYEQKKQFLLYLSLKKVLLQYMPSQISANNGPVNFIHQKEYLIAVEKKYQ
jgi:hypothetical protein